MRFQMQLEPFSQPQTRRAQMELSCCTQSLFPFLSLYSLSLPLSVYALYVCMVLPRGRVKIYSYLY